LRNITSSLKDAQPAADGAAPHLVDYTEKLASGLREQLRRDFSGQLQRVLEKMKWPGKELTLTDGLIKEWMDCVRLLLDLQEPYVAFFSPLPIMPISREEPYPLIPILAVNLNHDIQLPAARTRNRVFFYRWR